MRLAAWATSRVHALLTPERRVTLRQFARFGAVGVVGAIVDIGTVYASMAWLGLYAAGLAAYFAAVTTTWALNRAWTFAGRGDGSLLRQWALFVAANSLGFVLNRGTFALLVLTVPACARYPVIAILAGVGAGMLANFNLARSVVFRQRAQPMDASRPTALASE